MTPGGLHLEDFVFPPVAWVARKVKLSGHGKPGFSVEGEETVVQAERESGRIGRGAFVVARRARLAPGLAGIDANRRGGGLRVRRCGRKRCGQQKRGGQKKAIEL